MLVGVRQRLTAATDLLSRIGSIAAVVPGIPGVTGVSVRVVAAQVTSVLRLNFFALSISSEQWELESFWLSALSVLQR